MAAFATVRKNIFGVQSAVPQAPVPAQQTQRKAEYFYRFYSNKDELYWAFVYQPSDYTLEMTCKMLRLPNYEEVDAIEFQQAYKH